MQHNKEVLSVYQLENGNFALVTTQFEDENFVRSDDLDGEYSTREKALAQALENAKAAEDGFWKITKHTDDGITLERDEEAVRTYRESRDEESLHELAERLWNSDQSTPQEFETPEEVERWMGNGVGRAILTENGEKTLFVKHFTEDGVDCYSQVEGQEWRQA